MSTPADSSTAQPITFHQNSPRPPVVPGEETCAGLQSPIVQWGGKLCRGGSPIPTPRRSTLSHHESLPEGCAPLGFEPEGSSSPSAREPPSPPSCLRWARCLPALLEDPDGVELFRRYLESEGRSHADALDFWFACEGLRKQTDPDKIGQLVRVIYRRYFLKTQLGIGEELRKAVNRRIKDGGELDCGVFAESQQEVERIITETTYPNFLRSDIYLGHVQAMQNGSSSSSGSGSGSSGRDPVLGGGMLATVHEDSELTETPLPLTRDMLMVTQKRRATELRPKPEAYAGVFLQAHVTKGRMAYSSYNPVSRQDSELQSLSSDARTESDNMSLTDSSLDGSGHHRFSRKQYQRHCRQVKEAYPFDGPGSTLAHAFFPGDEGSFGGDIHFDDDETWKINPGEFEDGVDFFTVAVHEIGHSLGLSHSPASESVMNPYYKRYNSNSFTLGYDDILGMYELYITKYVEGDNESHDEDDNNSDEMTTRRTTTSRKPITTTTTLKPYQTTTWLPHVTYVGDDETVDIHKSHDPTHGIPDPEDPLMPLPPSRRTTTQSSSEVPDGCEGGFSAVSYLRGELFIFKDNYMWRLSSPGKIVSGYPVPIHRMFNRLPQNLHKIDAAYERDTDSNIIFFSGDRYWIYNGNDIVGGSSRSIYDYGLPSYVKKIDAVMVWARNRKTYIFSGEEFWRYNETAQKMDPGYPKTMERFRGVPSNLDSAVTWSDGITYFFKDNLYWAFNNTWLKTEPFYPQQASQYWLSCH